MSRKFDEKFADLINFNVPRTFILNHNSDNNGISVEYRTLEIDELPEPPSNGFIATYCRKNDK